LQTLAFCEKKDFLYPLLSVVGDLQSPTAESRICNPQKQPQSNCQLPIANRRQDESHQACLNRCQTESHQACLNGRGAKEEDEVNGRGAKEEDEANCQFLNSAPLYPISSTAIRTAIAAGDDVSPWLDPAVLDEIRRLRLYAQ